MSVMTKKEFGRWFTRKFLEWQGRHEGRKTGKQFAEYLELKNATVSQWLNGEAKPSAIYVFGLAKKIGLDIYDALDLPRPNPILFGVQAHWGLFTELEQERIARMVEDAKKRDEESEKNKQV